MSNTSGAPSRGQGILFPTAILCLLFSGLAGLLYQVVWTRYLALLTGHTSYAIVAVLAAFMGGLALGNAWLGGTADKLRRPLAFYGWLEIVIGIYALAFPDVFRIAYGMYTAAASGAATGSASLLGMKFIVALLTLIIPTVLMGGTLPVLTRMVTRSLGELQNRVSTLYFINSLGAVFGVGIAEFWLIPDTGLPGTLTYGAAINLAIGALALFISGYLREGSGPAAAPESAATNDTETFTQSEIRMAIIGIGVSGLVAMLYEIAWTRLLGLTMGSTSGAFAIMLITFILGIALGSWIIGRIRIIRNSLDWFAWMEIGIGVSVILTMFLYSRLPYWFSCLAHILRREEAIYPVFQTLEGLFSFAVMIVPTTILGMTLPLVSRISTAEVATTGRSVGFVFSFNTVGAVLGTIITGLWALPVLGLAQTFALGTGLNIAVGLVILARNAPPAQKKLVPLVLPGVVLWIVLAQSLFHKEWASLTTAGAYRMRGQAAESFAEYRAINQQPTLLYHRDGASATVTVKEFPKNHLFLQVNGKTDASTGTDMLTQLMLGHVPALLHAEPHSALVVGLGSGVTCGALLTHTGITNVDVVEISPEVVEAARYFGPVNENVLTNARLNVHIDDAKSFLNTAPKKYDIIISEPSNPWMAGVPGLFSVEFYRQAAERLESGGLMCQWLHTYEINQEGVDTIVATFTDTFRYTSIWLGGAGDLLLVGGTQPRETELDTVLRRSGHPRVRASLARGDILLPVTLLAHEVVSEDYAAYAFKEDTLLHSDLYPVLESLAQKGSFIGAETRAIFDYDERRTLRPNSLLAQYMAKHPLQPGDWASLIAHNQFETILTPELARSITSEWSLKHPKDPTPVMLGAMYKDDRKPTASDVAVMSFKLGDIVADPRRNVEWTVRFCYSAMMNYRFARSIFHSPQSDTLVTIMEKLKETFPDEAHIYSCYLAELAWDQGDQNKFLKLAADVFIRQGQNLAVSSFPDGEKSPAIVLTRLIEYFLENPDPEKLTHLIQVAERAGFASAEAPRLRAALGRAKYVTPPPIGRGGSKAPPPGFPVPGKQ